MAHPLTIHPPNMIAFGSPSTRSPLSFGFGQPSQQFGSISPAQSPAPNARIQGGVSAGFGLSFGSSTGPSSPLKRSLPFNAPRIMSPTTSSLPQSSLKRSRNASTSPSSSPSPLPTSPSSPNKRRSNDLANEDLPGVGQMQLREIGGRKIGPNASKRLRKDATTNKEASDVDIGVLLTTLPSSAHLPILQQLLQDDPSLASSVLARIPQPDLGSCISELDRIMTTVAKAAGTWETAEGPVAARRWHRVEKQMDMFTNTASTYIRFFTNPPNQSAPVADSRTIYSLLHALTARIFQLLLLIPPTSNPPPPSARPLLDLANLVLTNWSSWVNALSDEVNKCGGMYPHPTVVSWADGLESLSSTDTTTHQVPSLPSWATLTPVNVPPPPNQHPLVDGFRSALGPIRNRFGNELGWLVGPRHTNF